MLYCQMKASCYFCELTLQHILCSIFQNTIKNLNLVLNMTDTQEPFGLKKGTEEPKTDLTNI